MTEGEKTWDFDEWADGYDGWVTSDDPTYARYDEVLDRVVELAVPGPGKKILDIGTGTGNLAARLLDQGAQVVGLDPSKRMLALATGKLAAGSGLELRCLDQPFLRIPYPDEIFDAVVSTYAFHHVHPRKKRRCVNEMVRVLRPRGVWVLGDLIFENSAAEREALELYDWMEDEYFARIDELIPVFGEMGMKLESQRFTPVTWVLWAVKPERGQRGC